MYSTRTGSLLPIMNLTTDADFSGASGLVFYFRKRTGGVTDWTTGTGSLVKVSSSTSGSTFTYTWAAGETDDPGQYEGKIEGTIGGKLLVSPTISGFHFTLTVD